MQKFKFKCHFGVGTSVEITIEADSLHSAWIQLIEQHKSKRLFETTHLIEFIDYPKSFN